MKMRDMTWDELSEEQKRYITDAYWMVDNGIICADTNNERNALLQAWISRTSMIRVATMFKYLPQIDDRSIAELVAEKHIGTSAVKGAIFIDAGDGLYVKVPMEDDYAKAVELLKKTVAALIQSAIDQDRKERGTK